ARTGRPETVQGLEERRERDIALRHAVEAGQIEIETEDAPHLANRGLADRGGAGDPDDDVRVVHGAAPPYFVRSHWTRAARPAPNDVARDPIRGIVAPAVVARERAADVERAVGSENDLHRLITRLPSVPESCSRPATWQR